MKRVKKMRIALGSTCLLAAATYAYFFILEQPMRLIVENERNESLNDVLLSVGPHRFELGEFTPGQRKEKWFFYRGRDSSHHLEEVTITNEKIEANFGYITHGMGFERIYMEFRNDSTIYYRDNKRSRGKPVGGHNGD